MINDPLLLVLMSIAFSLYGLLLTQFRHIEEESLVWTFAVTTMIALIAAPLCLLFAVSAQITPIWP